jgi:hypothetical protein
MGTWGFEHAAPQAQNAGALKCPPAPPTPPHACRPALTPFLLGAARGAGEAGRAGADAVVKAYAAVAAAALGADVLGARRQGGVGWGCVLKSRAAVALASLPHSAR